VKKIPHQFHSFETDSPFTHCCDCNCELVESAQMYMVQKNYDGDECVMEYALCSNCKEQLDNQIHVLHVVLQRMTAKVIRILACL